MLLSWRDITEYEALDILAELDSMDLAILRSVLSQLLISPQVYFADYEGNEDDIDDFLSQFLAVTS